MGTFFSDFFDIDPKVIEEYGALDISLINDIPLFIDPFLLFNSEKTDYRDLHEEIISYLVFLKNKSSTVQVNDGILKSWYCFPEVKQNWLGFSTTGNSGSGLGIDFARNLHENLHTIFTDFGSEKVTQGSHIEKVCLIKDGIGRDNISDFTTNLIKDFLCRFTERFAVSHVKKENRKKVWIPKAKFNYITESWERVQYELPYINGDFIVLTPIDLLTRDENWINRSDLFRKFESIPVAMPDDQLRAQIQNYFHKVIVRPKDREPNKAERDDAILETIREFPQIIDQYIKMKEDDGDDAERVSMEKVVAAQVVFVNHLRSLQEMLYSNTPFYKSFPSTYEEAYERLLYLKDVIENKGGHKLFYHDGKPIEREKDLQILYRLVWIGTPSDVGAEANDGRGPVDYKISRGFKDKTLIEMKLAKNTQLERNLVNQVPVYQAASDASKAIKVIIFFSRKEEVRVDRILKKLNIKGHKDIVLIDARNDNKPSGSKA